MSNKFDKSLKTLARIYYNAERKKHNEDWPDRMSLPFGVLNPKTIAEIEAGVEAVLSHLKENGEDVSSKS